MKIRPSFLTADPWIALRRPGRMAVAAIVTIVAVVVVLLVTGVWLGNRWIHRATADPASPADARDVPWQVSYAPTQPLPSSIDLDTRKVALGQRLFHEVRLSADDSISCAHCHKLDAGGVDHRQFSVGVQGAVGSINAPTVFNSGFNFVQFWDGRAASLEDQIDGPVQNPLEMASNWPQVVGKLTADADYTRQFADVYADGITSANIKDAIATFERSLVTPNSRFDQFLRGDANALDAREQRGYALFLSYGCASCHQGINLGGNMYEKMGLIGDYFADRGHVTKEDQGRFRLTHKASDMHEFRVPSLRNVALTAPYFHDGSALTLEDAIGIMVKYQLGRSMPKDDLDALAAFLRSLTGQYQGRPL